MAGEEPTAGLLRLGGLTGTTRISSMNTLTPGITEANPTEATLSLQNHMGRTHTGGIPMGCRLPIEHSVEPAKHLLSRKTSQHINS